MKRIKLTIAYDGTNYCGWQRQKNALSIEELLEESCVKIFNQPVNIIGASRTDAGVHAFGQVATIDVDTNIPVDKIPYALNSQLPEDIVVHKAEEVDDSFHPRYSALMKTYRYSIYNGDFYLPQYKRYTVFESTKLNIDIMKQASIYLVGTHDFKAFCAMGGSAKTTIRTIYDINWEIENDTISFYITGNGFLYNMVRIIAGTLMDFGKKQMESVAMMTLIIAKDRELCGKTAPAKGLTLIEIKY